MLCISICLEYLLFAVVGTLRLPLELDGLGEPVDGVY